MPYIKTRDFDTNIITVDVRCMVVFPEHIVKFLDENNKLARPKATSKEAVLALLKQEPFGAYAVLNKYIARVRICFRFVCTFYVRMFYATQCVFVFLGSVLLTLTLLLTLNRKCLKYM